MQGMPIVVNCAAITLKARSVTAVAAEPALATALADLVVVVDQGDDLVAVPAVPGRLTQGPVAEQREVIRRVAVARDHTLQLARDVVDPQSRVQASLLHDFPGMLAAARHFPDQEESLLANALGEF